MCSYFLAEANHHLNHTQQISNTNEVPIANKLHAVPIANKLHAVPMHVANVLHVHVCTVYT